MSCLIESGMRLLKDERGASSIEYVIIASLLSIVIIGAVNAIGTSLNLKFVPVSEGLSK
jgi:pilus assembly protein Flp/PilA